ncbi:MAG: hypothetical protein ACJ8FM_17810 [Xanthobacteraceae bacterium]
MSSPLEGVPQDPRVFSAPAAPRRPWLKIAAAFAAGVVFAAGIVCSVLVITFLTAPHKAAQPQQAKLRTPTEAASNASSSPAVRREQPANVPAPHSSPQTTQTSATPEAPPVAAEASASNPDGAAAEAGDAVSGQSADLSCERQTWPYVDHSCAGADANAPARRSVRVITTDRSAPATVMTAAPPPPSRTTDGMAPPPASTVDRTTNGSSGSMDVASREPAGADRPQQSDSNIASGQIGVPMPRPKPDELTRTAAAPANGPDVVPQATTSAPPAAGESRQTRKSAERRHTRRSLAEREATTRDPRSDMRRAKEDLREAQDEEARTLRPLTPEEATRVVRPRATQQEPIRGGRPRATPAEDDDGYTLVRSSRSRDSRRASVRQKQVEEEGGAAAREQRPRSPFPFFFNPAAPGD